MCVLSCYVVTLICVCVCVCVSVPITQFLGTEDKYMAATDNIVSFEKALLLPTSWTSIDGTFIRRGLGKQLVNNRKIGVLARVLWLYLSYGAEELASIATDSPAIVHIHSCVNLALLEDVAALWPRLETLDLDTGEDDYPIRHVVALSHLSGLHSLRSLVLPDELLIDCTGFEFPPTIEQYSGVMTAALCESLCKNGDRLTLISARGKWSDHALLNAFLMLVTQHGARLVELTMTTSDTEDAEADCSAVFEAIGTVCTNLEKLRVSNGRTNDYYTFDTLSTLLAGSASSLRYLNLDWYVNYEVGQSDGDALLRVSALCPGLTELDVSWMTLSDANFDALESVLRGNTIRRLVMYIHLHTHDAFVRLRDILLQCTSLRQFVWMENMVTAEHITVLRELRKAGLCAHVIGSMCTCDPNIQPVSVIF
jgi:hypothetical protein